MAPSPVPLGPVQGPSTPSMPWSRARGQDVVLLVVQDPLVPLSFPTHPLNRPTILLFQFYEGCGGDTELSSFSDYINELCTPESHGRSLLSPQKLGLEPQPQVVACPGLLVTLQFQCPSTLGQVL